MAQYDPAEDGADYPLYDSDDPGDLYANDGDWPDPPQRWRHTRWAVYGGAFALPLVLLIALLALLARLDGPDESPSILARAPQAWRRRMLRRPPAATGRPT